MSEKQEEFYLLIDIARDTWSGDTVRVNGLVARPRDFGQSDLVHGDSPYLTNLTVSGSTWFHDGAWHLWMVQDFEYVRQDTINLSLAERMYKTLALLKRRTEALRDEMGPPANLGQSVQWAVKIVKAAGIAIRVNNAEDFGWQIWRNGDIAWAVNYRVDLLKKEIQP